MLVAQTGDLRPKADSSPSSVLGAAAMNRIHLLRLPWGRQPRSQIRLLRMAATRRRFVLLHDWSGSGRRWARKQIHSPSPHECGQHRQPSGRHEVRFVSFVWPPWRPHEGDSCCFTTGVAQGGGGRGSRFFAFTARVRPASPAERPGTKPDSYHSYGGHTKQSRAPSAAADH